jgi:hypothetical protein
MPQEGKKTRRAPKSHHYTRHKNATMAPRMFSRLHDDSIMLRIQGWHKETEWPAPEVYINLSAHDAMALATWMFHSAEHLMAKAARKAARAEGRKKAKEAGRKAKEEL